MNSIFVISTTNTFRIMKIKDVSPILETMAPLGYAEDFDNVGFLTGPIESNLTGILVCHDALESVVDEAIEKKCNLIVCFHPILFSGIKKITGKNYVERAIIKAIKNDIAIYSVHTALDNHKEGVNKILCNQLGLTDTSILVEKKGHLRKLYTYAPKECADILVEKLFEAGAGNIGKYNECSFSTEGIGTFKPTTEADPTIGKVGKREKVEEIKLEFLYEKHLENKMLQTLRQYHTYEEIAYEIISLENKTQDVGLGMIGSFKEPISEIDFLNLIRQKCHSDGIRHSQFLNKPIQKVAVLGGSGSFAIQDAIQSGADAFITADLKYHQYYEAESKILLADIGHFESESYTKNYIVDYLIKKIPNFAIILSEQNTNPVKYF